MKRRRIDLNDLSSWSAWPTRIFGLTPWTVPSRTIEKIDHEYDKSKYARCLDYYTRAGENTTPEEIIQFEIGLDPASKGCMSLGNELYEVNISKATAEYYRFVVDTVRSEVEKCKTIVELGCGYGYNLWMLKQHFGAKTFVGGEYSNNAVKLAAHL